MTRIDKFERCLDIMWKLHRLVFVFFTGMLFMLIVIVLCYISTGGK